jgi:antitoxin component YwqK of YwqJK toxin-antitoxin module
MREKYTEYHTDGSIHARGNMLDGVPDGYWEWFRLDGTKMRSGYFKKGVQVGEWVTYDRQGRPHKVTSFDKKKTPKKTAKK